MKPKRGYPAESYQRLYDPTVGPLWSATEGLSPDEDADHYCSEGDFFEWWYFDAAFENGYQLVAILHSSLFNAVDHKPTVDVRITPPDRASTGASERYTRAVYRAAADHCDVQIAGCRAAVESHNRYTLRLRQAGLSADLVYESRLPGWRPGTGYLLADGASGHFFKWVVPVPRAVVTGTLTMSGQTMEVRGVGYHDHNWGNLVLGDAFSHWYWGRCFAGDSEWVIIFGDGVGYGLDPAHVTPFLLVADEQIVPDVPAVTFRQHDLTRERLTGVRYPNRLDVSARTDSYQATVSLRTARVVEALDFASPPFRRRWPRQAAEIAFYLSMGKPLVGTLVRRLLGKASYLRLQAQADLSLCAPQETHLTGHAIYEIMQFH